jgi:glycopeptide antibiotics resistance protein
MSRRLWLAAFVGYLLLGAAVVLAPSSDPYAHAVTWLVEVMHGLGAPGGPTMFARTELALNVLLAVPVSVIGAQVLSTWSWERWTACAFLVALGVEVAQALVLPARDPAFRDVVANTGGVMLGALLVRLSRPTMT